MTKKSLARQERDRINKSKEFLETPPWDSLKEIYSTQTQMLATIEKQVVDFFQIEHVASFIPSEEKSKVITQMRALQTEINFFRKELDKLFNLHKDRSGPMSPGEHMIDIIAASEGYTNLSVRIEAIVTPIYHYLLSIMGVVEKKAALVANAPDNVATAEPTPA